MQIITNKSHGSKTTCGILERISQLGILTHTRSVILDAIQTSAANYHYFIQGNENHNSSVCYMIKMDFVNLLNSDENQINGDVWVVQAAISDACSK